MPRYAIAAAVALALAHVANAQLSLEPSPTPDANVQLLRWLDHANVRADFLRHVTKEHDLRFIAVYGFTTIIPGTHDQRDSALIRRHGFRYIKGTSDAIMSPEHGRLNDKAEAYAEQYNVMLLHFLRSHKRT